MRIHGNRRSEAIAGKRVRMGVEEASVNVSECKAQSDVRQDPGRGGQGTWRPTAEACLRSRM